MEALCGSYKCMNELGVCALEHKIARLNGPALFKGFALKQLPITIHYLIILIIHSVRK